jgi:ABC-2 type transport system ATP-binding protein
MIRVNNLNKEFKVHKKEAGFWASASSLFNRQYITNTALKDFNLEVAEGEIIGLIGANGAGKTTLTKILSGIIHPTSGDVSVLGFTPWERKNEYRKQMAVIMGQKAQLWWDLPAMDGFLLLKEIYQIPEKEFKESVEHLANYLGVKGQLNIQVRRLSLGERMKVELIAALLHKPKVIFLDEPTIGLDITAQKAIRSFLKTYREEHNATIILTSHYMDDIEELCNRIVILRDGKKVYDGDITTIQNQYAPNKIIIAHTDEIEEYKSLPDVFPKELGVLSIDDKKIHIVTPKDSSMQAAKFLIDNTNIKDLTIQGEEIANLIEKIMISEDH